mgnify:CR=1 FL=1
MQKIKTREYKDTMLLRLSNLVLKEINLLKETSNNKEEMLDVVKENRKKRLEPCSKQIHRI